MNNYELFKENLKRAESVISLYEKNKKNDDFKNTRIAKNSDLLRMAVVFLHSSFENYFRDTIAEMLINSSDNETIKKLLTKGDTGIKLKIEDLLNIDRSWTFDDYVKKRIKEKMSFSSFNSSKEIIYYLELIKMKFDNIDWSCLDLFINRRHKIVHEADKDSSNEKGKLRIINIEQVKQWKEILINLVDNIENNIKRRNIMSNENENQKKIGKVEDNQAFTSCPDCGKPITNENDAGNGFCKDCAPNH